MTEPTKERKALADAVTQARLAVDDEFYQADRWRAISEAELGSDLERFRGYLDTLIAAVRADERAEMLARMEVP